jgi:hypothetical protein
MAVLPPMDIQHLPEVLSANPDDLIPFFSVSQGKNKSIKVSELTPGGGPITASEVSYTNPSDPLLANVQEALDQLLYVAPTVSMNSSVTVATTGQTINSLTLSWTWNKNIIAQEINNGIGFLPAAQRTDNLTSLGLTSSQTWTISGSDGTNGATSSAGVVFEYPVFYGVSSDVTPNEATVNSLSNYLSLNFHQSQTISASGQYIYFAWPSSFGTPTFTVNGLLNTAWVKTTISYTNTYSLVLSYDCYRSTYVQYGVGIQVSVS